MQSQSKRVLVVENDEVVLVLIAHILTRRSYTVETTRSAFEADRLLQRQPYDVVMIDMNMPSGGAELIRRMSDHSPSLVPRVIAVTTGDSHLGQLDGMPVHAVTRKPLEIGAVVDLVRDCIDSNA